MSFLVILSLCLINFRRRLNFIGILSWKHFQPIKSSITNDITLKLHNTKHPSVITEKFSLIGIDCVLLQLKNKGKLDFEAFNYNNFYYS